MDGCGVGGNKSQAIAAYSNYSKWVNKTGRPIHFEVSDFGAFAPWEWAGAIANSWRMSGDHSPNWPSTKEIINTSAYIPREFSGREFAWNDMDMLQTGNVCRFTGA